MALCSSNFMITGRYARRMRYADGFPCVMRIWTAAANNLVGEAGNLPFATFPHLPLTYKALDYLTTDMLPVVGIGWAHVPDANPGSPIPEGTLLSQVEDTALYATRVVGKVSSCEVSASISPERWKEAWKQVVHRHPILRTIMVESPFCWIVTSLGPHQ
ncbi:hypothetical protein BDV38DRAFT_284089 [Aspergillus pseudotamarii]|uniref:Condensation domain-containing protein n=1 Tax=Aspergillus pseudotamarii TaxID=132259 RepID=A0A5N6SSH3_ASPPS|nr:uncharacterized protein BDV38DRAFT_284089 [Aspergillus pseudotamarii]KAE8136343.1 hypothetical protein BDV38DRAFT_284089 [Aspergillus pseudotamarii]